MCVTCGSIPPVGQALQLFSTLGNAFLLFPHLCFLSMVPDSSISGKAGFPAFSIIISMFHLLCLLRANKGSLLLGSLYKTSQLVVFLFKRFIHIRTICVNFSVERKQRDFHQRYASCISGQNIFSKSFSTPSGLNAVRH